MSVRYEEMLNTLALGMWRKATRTMGNTVSFTLRHILEYANANISELSKRDKWIMGALLSEFAKSAGCERRQTSYGIRIICSKEGMPLGSFEEFREYLDRAVSKPVEPR